MGGFIKTVVRKPVTMLIIFLILTFMGVYTASDLPIDLFPDIDFPVLVVFCQNEGSGPTEIESNITRTLESSLTSVSGVKNMTSTSSTGLSLVMLEFDYGTNLDVATNDVRDKLEMVKHYLPEDAENPTIFKFDPSMMPIVTIAVTGNNRTTEELFKMADDIIAPRFEQIVGVSSANVGGGRERIIRVEASQNRLNALDLTLTSLASAIAVQNSEISAGSVTQGGMDFLVQTAGEYKNVEEIKDTLITVKGGKVVRLSDIANVYDGYQDVTESATYNGKPIVYLRIQKQSGGNTVEVANKIKERLPQIEAELPDGVKLEILRDSSKMISNSIDSVIESAVSGAILAVIVLFIFLRDIKSTLIVACSMPVSIAITFLFMYLGGQTLNMMTLSGLVLGIGMLVDNSIVILENIFKYREKGSKIIVAAELGAKEMVTAIMASTLTTICVFVPTLMFSSKLEVMGVMMNALAFTIVISLVSSILVAAMLVPVLSSKYFPVESKLEKQLPPKLKAIDDAMERFFDWLGEAYKSGLKFVLHHRAVTIVVVVLMLIVSCLGIKKIGFEFAPQQEADAVTLEFKLPLGTTYEVTRDFAEQIKLIVEKEVRGYEGIMVKAGGSSSMLGSAESNYGEIMIRLPDWDLRIDRENDIKEKLRKHFDEFPNAKFSFGTNGGGMGSAKPIEFVIKSNDMVKLLNTSKQIKDLIKEHVPEATEPDIDMDDGLPQWKVVVDREKAYSFGLNIYTLGNEISANLDGKTASLYKEGGDNYDILVILQESDRQSILDLDKIFVISPITGKRIALSNVAHIEETTGPVTIKRENQMRTIKLTAGLKKGAKLNEITAQIQKLIKEQIPKDEGVIISVGGDMENMSKIGKVFLMIIVMAIVLVFGVMASQFESFSAPFIILSTMPLMIIGVVIVYLMSGEPFSAYTLIGLLVLVGVVVNTGIVLVDYMNLLIKRGYSIFDACVEGGSSRLRPVLMSVLTTVLGMVPMAIDKGEGSELMRPIAQTMVGGLTTSTIFTLFLIPVLYSLLMEHKEKKAIKKQKKLDARMALRRERLLEMQAKKKAKMEAENAKLSPEEGGTT
jgi:HAE1 family hydrophobic/amphiphilic exporter-1